MWLGLGLVKDLKNTGGSTGGVHGGVSSGDPNVTDLTCSVKAR